MNAAVIATARASAAQRGLRYLLVARHGHLLLDYYATPGQAAAWQAGGALQEAGTLSAALRTQLGEAVPVESQALAAAISRQLWQPLNAQPARLVDGTVYAHAADWLRLGLMLLGGGQFEGTEIAGAARVADVHYDSVAPSGESPAHREARALRAPGRVILWLVPPLQLAVLQGGGASGSADTDFVNALIRGIDDQPGEAAQRSLLNRLVPGH